MAEGNAVYCDDCGREKMAEVRDGKIVIMDRRHGRRHVAVIPLGREGRGREVGVMDERAGGRRRLCGGCGRGGSANWGKLWIAERRALRGSRYPFPEAFE